MTLKTRCFYANIDLIEQNMIVNNQPQYTKLEDLPSLKQGWIRLVHHCIYKDHVDSIRENGLIFNREAAKLSPLQRGSSYIRVKSFF